MPSSPLPLMTVWPSMTSGDNVLGPTPARLTLIARPALAVKAPSVILSGHRVATPSAAVLRTLLRTMVRFCPAGEGGGVGMPTEIPVTAYRVSDSVRLLPLLGSRMRPVQSPGTTAGQIPEILGTNTEPQLGRCR